MDKEGLQAPQHVAIILDGNGRWAKKRFLPRNAGHAQGSRVVEKICEDAYDVGIKYLTVYAFSTENWKRPKEEVDALMKLLRQYLKDCIKRSQKNNMRVRVLGDATPLDDDIRASVKELEEASASNDGLNFQVALNYGGRDEIVRAAKRLARDCVEGRLDLDGVTEDAVARCLDTGDIPDPDLLIRTSGEMRLSNFLLWQLAYTEFYFTDVLWPDFSKKELMKAVEYYNSKDRRYGSL